MSDADLGVAWAGRPGGGRARPARGARWGVVVLGGRCMRAWPVVLSRRGRQQDRVVVRHRRASATITTVVRVLLPSSSAARGAWCRYSLQ